MTTIQRWFVIVGMWTVVIFAIVAFYWVFVRPAKIRQMCAARAKQVSTATKSDLSNMLEINRALYLDCLRCNGIEK